MFHNRPNLHKIEYDNQRKILTQLLNRNGINGDELLGDDFDDYRQELFKLGYTVESRVDDEGYTVYELYKLSKVDSVAFKLDIEPLVNYKREKK